MKSSLSLIQQRRLFHAHVEHLHSKHIDNLRVLFQFHAPSLDSPFTSLPLPFLLSSQPVIKLGLDIHSLEHEFEKWQRERTAESRKVFDQMLSENSFVEFWGRLGKLGGEGVNGGVKADEIEEGGGGKVDMKALAKNINVQEMEKVLKVDISRSEEYSA
jgi:heat shock protein beta